MNKKKSDFFRRDQSDGVTPPNLLKNVTYAEHIVRARGKRSQFTSVSTEKNKITDFGPTLYQLIRDAIDDDGHEIIEHIELITNLQETVKSTDKEERTRAIQALRYARRRFEGLVKWNFTLDGTECKNIITWTFKQIQKYFTRQ